MQIPHPQFLICDDEAMVCEVLYDALRFGQSQLWKEVPEHQIALTHRLSDVHQKLREGFHADLAWVDLQLFQERLGGLAVAQALRQNTPGIKIVIMTHYTHQLRSEDLVAIADLKPEACIHKHKHAGGSIVDYLLQCGEAVMQGDTRFATDWQDYFTYAHMPILKGQQKEVAKLRAQNLSPKAIACRLSVSESTIYTHLRRIEANLGFKCPPKLLSYCKHRSWLQ